MNAVHGIAYAIAGATHRSHGTTNAVMLPYVLEELAAARCDELLDVADIFGIATTDRNQAVRELCEAIRSLIESIGIPTTLKELGIDQASLPSLLNDALAVTRLLKAFPVTDAKAAYERILHRAYDGEPGEFLAAARLKTI